jgi:hypothetical protein
VVWIAFVREVADALRLLLRVGFGVSKEQGGVQERYLIKHRLIIIKVAQVFSRYKIGWPCALLFD